MTTTNTSPATELGECFTHIKYYSEGLISKLQSLMSNNKVLDMTYVF